MLTALLSLEDMQGSQNRKRKAELEQKIDDMLDDGDFDILEPYFDLTVRDDIDPPALMKFTGYVVRRAKKGSIAKSCCGCFQSLKAPEDRIPHEDEDLIHYISNGHLLVPSDPLMNIIYRCENCILNVLDKNTTGIDKRVIFQGNNKEILMFYLCEMLTLMVYSHVCINSCR